MREDTFKLLDYEYGAAGYHDEQEETDLLEWYLTEMLSLFLDY